jgi:hypothetical protein
MSMSNMIAEIVSCTVMWCRNLRYGDRLARARGSVIERRPATGCVNQRRHREKDRVMLTCVGCPMLYGACFTGKLIVETSHSIATLPSPASHSHQQIPTSRSVPINPFLPPHAIETKTTPKWSKCLYSKRPYLTGMRSLRQRCTCPWVHE